jgi:hypothetical protein
MNKEHEWLCFIAGFNVMNGSVIYGIGMNTSVDVILGKVLVDFPGSHPEGKTGVKAKKESQYNAA